MNDEFSLQIPTWQLLPPFQGDSSPLTLLPIAPQFANGALSSYTMLLAQQEINLQIYYAESKSLVNHLIHATFHYMDKSFKC